MSDLQPYRVEIPEEEPAPEVITPPRIPNLGHATLFLTIAAFLLIVSQLILYGMGKSPAATQSGTITVGHPKLQLAAMGATYLITLLASWFLYPLLWKRTFFDGINWNWQTARQQAPRLIALGLLLGAIVQAVTYFITAPKSLPIDDFFATPSDAWLITFFGTILAPAFEEIAFRGFLVPAFAIAYDWLSLPRTPEAHHRWQSSTTLTPASLLFSAILTSIFFAMLHFEQIAHVWALLLVLFSVSLVLTFVRVKTNSVASSAIVHGAYNFFIFLLALISTGGYRHLDRLTR